MLKCISRCTGVLVAALVCMPAPVAGQASRSGPIAYVSVQRVLSDSNAAKAGAKELEALRATRTEALKARRDELEALRLQIANSGGYFSGARREQLTATARQKEAELQQATQQAQTDFQDLQRKFQDTVREQLNGVLTDLARQRGYVFILNQDAAVLLGPSSANITDDVLARLNALPAADSSKSASDAAKSDAAKKE
jgi:outer membrane protein